MIKLIRNEPNSDPANAKDVHDLNESPPSNRTKSNRSVEESDSFRKLKDEIMEDKEEEGYLVERDEASL